MAEHDLAHATQVPYLVYERTPRRVSVRALFGEFRVSSLGRKSYAQSVTALAMY